jgi:hypothetical protein
LPQAEQQSRLTRLMMWLMMRLPHSLLRQQKPSWSPSLKQAEQGEEQWAMKPKLH